MVRQGKNLFRLFFILTFYGLSCCPNTVLGRYIQPDPPSISSLAICFFIAICGLVNYIFLTLYLGGMGWDINGTTGRWSLCIFLMTHQIHSILSFFVAHIQSWENIFDKTTIYCCLFNTFIRPCIVVYSIFLSVHPSLVVWSIIFS